MNLKHWLLIIVSCLVVVFAGLEIVVLFQLEFVSDDMTWYAMISGASLWVVLFGVGLYLVIGAKETDERIIFACLTLVMSIFAGLSIAGLCVGADAIKLAARILNAFLGFVFFVAMVVSFSVWWGECGRKAVREEK